MARAARGCLGALLATVGLVLISGSAEAGKTRHATVSSHHRSTTHASIKQLTHAGAAGRHSVRRMAPHAVHTAAPMRRTAPVVAPGPIETSKPLIVIDPGHGGHDPGAIGVSGTQEKTVTLAIGLELRQALQATGRYRIALTRTRDTTVSLSDRLNFARDHEADLLIAIHADASPDRHTRGASVYVGSGGAVRTVAVKPAGQIAQALSQEEPPAGATSAWLQYSMIEQLADDVRMAAAPARAGHLYVLGARNIPSVLLETGFLSNRKDEALLKQPAHRQVLVRAIRDAVDDYFDGMKAGAGKT